MSRTGKKARRKIKFNNYILFKFYIPEYGIQGRPIPIKVEDMEKRGYRWGLHKAEELYIKYGLRPVGKIHPSHENLLVDGRITHDSSPRRLSEKQANNMLNTLGGRQRKVKDQVGWKRSV